MTRKGVTLKGSRVLIMGLAFKENTPDVRNSRVIDIIHELQAFGAEVDVWDPWISAAVARHEYGLDLVQHTVAGSYDGVVLAVAHREFRAMGVETIRSFGRPNAVLFDVKAVLPRGAADLRL
jgi:UDP-N-acetyl-D-galactosamine dehydrogenase